MSEDIKDVSDVPATTVSDSSQESQTTAVSDSGNQTVQYQSHKKLLGQHKKALAELDSMKEKLSMLENDKLEAEGNKDKLIESLKQQVADKDTRLRSTVGNIAQKNAMSAIVEEAVKVGCNSPAIVKKFLTDKIDTLQFDENFEPDRDQVIELVNEAKLEAPTLFGKAAPGIANHNVSKGSTSDNTKSLKKMSMDELMNSWGESI